MGDILIEHQDRFPPGVRENLGRLAEISKTLRKDRELAFSGDIDFITTEEYGPEEGREALEGARFVVDVARRLIRL